MSLIDKYTYSIVELPGTTSILKGTLSSNLCDELEEKARPFVENVNCNLKDTKRTGWQIFKEEEIAPLFQKVTDRITHTILAYFERRPALVMGGRPYFNVDTRFADAWVAWYSDNSFIRPHVHGAGGMFNVEYSLAAYLKVPEDYTELTFCPFGGNTLENHTIEVRKGDFLVFPSNLMHYTNKCKEGRVILSANFSVHISVMGSENGQEVKE